ncbi:MAG: SpoIID/LytB domain-containing protein, partial [Acidobacteria bacterium]|nr:SpoIID/LytB domain-containing protein [Acidobacteriota bacterium]
MESKLKMIDREPYVSIGLMAGVEKVRFELKGEFAGRDGARFNTGSFLATTDAGRIEIINTSGDRLSLSSDFQLTPAEPRFSFVIHDVVIGIDFHWQQKQALEFQGVFRIKLGSDGQLIVINENSVESYLTSVISSEMSAASHPELLKAHSIISRSWLLAQLEQWKMPRQAAP